MEGGEGCSENFIGEKEMAQIGARIAAASRTLTCRVNGARVFCVTSVLDEDAAVPGEKASVAGAARWEDAIHHVDAAGNVIGDLLGASHAHEVTGLFGGKKRSDFGSDFTGDFVRFADGETADGVAGKIESDKVIGGFAAQMRVRAALNDAEHHLTLRVSVLAEIFERASGPCEGARGGGGGAVFGGGGFDAFIEYHDDVGAEGKLDFDGAFGREEMFGAVDVRAEGDAVVGDFAKIGEAEDLVAAGVGDDGMRPGHEFMEAAQFANQSGAGAKIQMVGVGEDDLRAEGFEGFLREAFNRAERTNGHERGRVDDAVWSFEAAEARAGWVGRQNFKTKRHSPSVSGEHGGDGDLDEDEGQPNSADPCERAAEFDFFGAHGGIGEGHQAQHPEGEDVE